MQSWKRVLAVSFGKAIEYYDLAIYLALKDYIQANFIPESVFGSDSSFIYWVGFGLRYVLRPLGGFLIGSYADRYGRKPTLIFISIATGIATLTMAILPSYHQFGILATCFFFFCQMVQSFSFSGESATAFVYLLEGAKENEQARTNALIWAFPVLSVALSIGLVFSIKLFLTEDQMYSFGWKIPLLLGLINIILSYYFKSKLSETVCIHETKKKESVQLIQVFKIFLLTAPATIIFHNIAVSNSIIIKKFTADPYMQSYLPAFFNIILFVTCFIVSSLIDKFSHCQVILKRSYFIIMFLAMPVYALQSMGTWPAIIIAQVFLTLFFALVYSSTGTVMFNAAPSNNKVATIATGMNLAVASLGAFTPLVVSILSQYGQAYIGLFMSFGSLCFFAALALDKYTQSASAPVSTVSS